MQEIRTERLVLRPFRESDYDDLFEFYVYAILNTEFMRQPENGPVP